MRQGQIMVYSQGKTKEESDVVNTDDYKLKVKKTWVEATSIWHIQILSQSIFDNRFEMFLTHSQLQAFKDAL
jgi:hypothetical protein